MADQSTCPCGSNCETNLIYSCSGAANTGLLADQVMRALMRDKVGSGTCLAAVGADLSGFIVSAQNATRNIVIDGCPVGCGKRIFESKGLPFIHFVTTNYGVEKGKTSITGDVIESLSAKIASEIQTAKVK